VYGVSIDLCCQVVHACHRKTRKVNLCTEFCQVYRVVVVVAGCLSGYCHVTTNRLSGLSRMAVISVAVRWSNSPRASQVLWRGQAAQMWVAGSSPTWGTVTSSPHQCNRVGRFMHKAA